MVTQADAEHLRRCLELAVRGRGRVSPNPMVGAVVVDGGEVIGEGHHAELGGPHAEVAALAAVRERGADPRGATMYVSLEPCAHQGRQPPCTEAIADAGLARVVIAAADPSAKASGLGPTLLRERGMEVEFADEGEPVAVAARLQNQPFRKHARTGMPLVTLKAAMTLDGFTAASSGDSKWISGEESRALVHRWRGECDAVAVGIETALADDPLLTARDLDAPPPRQPSRVVFDSAARLPLESQLVATVGDAPLILIVDADRVDTRRAAALREAGASVLMVEGGRSRQIALALDALGKLGVTSVLLEGGARLAGAFAAAGELDELRLFYAPVVLGGGRPVLAGGETETMADATRPLAVDWEPSGPDMLMRARMREW